MLGEPTNDLDTDMLAAMEDLLDNWPGTLIVVSHDRYFLERVTDQQYAILDGSLRHLPGGVDEYLSLRQKQTRDGRAREVSTGGVSAPTSAVDTNAAQQTQTGKPNLSGRELRDAEKELASLERRMEKLTAQAAQARTKLAELDQSDYQRLADEMAAISELERENAQLEERWLELSELIG